MKPNVHPRLMPGEQILFASGIHWKNYIIPLLALAVLAILLALKSRMHGMPLTNYWIAYAGDDAFILGGKAAGAVALAEYAAIVWMALAAAVGIVRRMKIGYFVTDRRIIKMWGWLNLHSTEIQLNRCKAVHVKENIYERIFGTGDAVITTAETQVYFDDVPQVRTFADIIEENVTRQQIEDKGESL